MQEQRRKAAIALLLLLALGLGAAALWVAGHPSTTATSSALRLARPTEPPALRPAAAGSYLDDRLRAASDLDVLFDAFRDSGSPPALKKFAESVREDPELDEIVEDFEADQKSPQPRQSLETLARRLREKPGFRAMLSEASRDSAFRDAAVSLSQTSPRVAALIRSLASDGPVPVRDGRALAVSGSPPRPSAAGGTPAVQSAGASGSEGARVVGGSGPRHDVGSAVAASSNSPDRTVTTGEATQGRLPSSSLGSGPEAHDTVAIEKGLKSAGSGVVAGSDFFSRCFQAGSGISHSECMSIKDAFYSGTYSLKGACFAAGLFDKCKALCAQAGMDCGTLDFESACLEVKSLDECAALCGQRPDCAAPGGAGGGGTPPSISVTNLRRADGVHADVSWVASCASGFAWCKSFIGGQLYKWTGEAGGPQIWVTDGAGVQFECQCKDGGRGSAGD